MTRTKAIKLIKQLSYMTARSTGHDNEIRVTYTGVDNKAAEEAAYYTTDPDDALGTANFMSKRRVTQLGTGQI